MRILHIDIDSLRPDHLGCYGYHRRTSPHIDALAASGVRFDNVYASDAPCLPSRTAQWSGLHGFRSGVVGHGGTAAETFREGSERGFVGRLASSSWMTCLRGAGMRTVTFSPFAARHGAWHWLAGYSEVYDTGGLGNEIADEVVDPALHWLRQHGEQDGWFLHVNLWDPHTAYRAPTGFGHPFADESPPEWLDEAWRQRCWDGYGPHSAQEPTGFGAVSTALLEQYPRMPPQLDSMHSVRRWIDGYDTGILYADTHVGRLLEELASLRVLDDTAIIVTADHGENQGELNIWGDHQTADHCTSRVPLIVRWPGITGRIERSLHYQFDWSATLIELVDGQLPEGWDGRSFKRSFKSGEDAGRSHLVLGQGAWTCQRAVRFGRYLCMRTYHDGFHDLPPVSLFDLVSDPHEQHDLVAEQPAVVARAMELLVDWQQSMMERSATDVDPLMTVLREGGPFHIRGELTGYLDRLRKTGRAHHADTLAARHPEAR